MTRIEAWAPGRVNLIGEHTDYTGGLCLPMAIQMGTTIQARAVEGRITLRSSDAAGAVEMFLPLDDPSQIEPAWGRYVGGVAASLSSTVGMEGHIESTLPLGAGLSSSAALEVATALALLAVAALDRHDSEVDAEASDARTVALLCQRAEQLASGVPCGVMDQLASAGGIEGHALRLDCETLAITPVTIPEGAQIVVVDSGQQRRLAGSAYGDRRAECEAAQRIIGPLRHASLDSVDQLTDDTMRRRARHVVTENGRVDEFAAAISRGDLASAGATMIASHASLRDDFDVSTPQLDDLVATLVRTDGVHGARLTGAGFGGCVVALAESGVDAIPAGYRGWIVTPCAGAAVRVMD